MKKLALEGEDPQGTFSQFNTGGQYTVDLGTSRDTTFTFHVTD